MFSIVGRLDKENKLVEGFNADAIVSFKVGKKSEGGEMVLNLTFSDGTKETLSGEEAQTFYEKVLCKNLSLSLNAMQIGGANKMLNTLQTQMGVARKKAEKEAVDKAKATARPEFRRMI